MTKAELTKSFQAATGLTYSASKEYLERLGDIMAAELLAGGEVPLPRVGKLTTRQTAARRARNPRTGEPLQIPAGWKACLVPSQSLRTALKQQ